MFKRTRGQFFQPAPVSSFSPTPKQEPPLPQRLPPHTRGASQPKGKEKKSPNVYAPTPCLEAGCQEHATRQGRCNTHQRPAWYGSTRKSRLPSDWSTRRLVVLKRDKGICHLCGEPGADTVDHVIAGDDHSLGNLKAVHDKVPPHCHRFKSSAEGHQAQRDNQIKRRH